MIKNIRITVSIGTLLLLGVVFFVPSQYTFASTTTNELEIAGWIPYFAETAGIPDADKHLDDLDTIHPFGYTVKSDGTLVDLMGIKDDNWDDLIDEAQDEDVEVIPTIMWSNGTDIHAILSDPEKREDHIDAIVSMVKKNRFDGVDIDYEGKLIGTREYFSAFLTELNSKLGSRYTLVCTIEARTPPASLYRIIPAGLAYVNDYTVIGKNCDRVQLMTYDQGRADILLNSLKSGAPYIPVADTDWVRKVAELALKDIPKEKIMLGVATYGHEYEVTIAPNWFKSYKKLWSVSPTYAVSTGKSMSITPSRNKAGEMAITYPNMTTPKFPTTLTIPKDTLPGLKTAAQALAYANQTGKTFTFNMMTWSDATAIEAKIELAKELRLRGIVIFKIDGLEDPETWNILQ